MDTPPLRIRFVARVGLVLICLAVVAACRAAAANAQGAVSGHVLDAETAVPLADVTVRAIDQNGATRTLVFSDSAGFFLLTLPRGRYTLVAERIGYGVLSTPDVQVRHEEMLGVVLKLRDQNIRIVDNVPRIVRRGSTCSPALYINGVPLQTSGRGASTDISTMLSPDDLEGVEIYPSEIHMPGELWRPNHNCGAIAFWTRVNRGNPFSMRRIGIAAGFVAVGLLVLAQ